MSERKEHLVREREAVSGDREGGSSGEGERVLSGKWQRGISVD